MAFLWLGGERDSVKGVARGARAVRVELVPDLLEGGAGEHLRENHLELLLAHLAVAVGVEVLQTVRGDDVGAGDREGGAAGRCVKA